MPHRHGQRQQGDALHGLGHKGVGRLYPLHAPLRIHMHAVGGCNFYSGGLGQVQELVAGGVGRLGLQRGTQQAGQTVGHISACVDGVVQQGKACLPIAPARLPRIGPLAYADAVGAADVALGVDGNQARIGLRVGLQKRIHGGLRVQACGHGVEHKGIERLATARIGPVGQAVAGDQAYAVAAG